MKIIWRKLLVICCIAVMLVTLPGVYVLADEATTDVPLVTDAMSINDADLSMNTVEDMTQAPAVAPAYDSSNANNSIDPDIEIEVADSVIIDESDENGNGKDFLDSQLFEQSASIGDVTITVCAEEGTFPADAILVVESLPANIQEGAVDAVNEIRDETLIVAESYTFDVKVLDAIGNELQPAENRNVSISFEASDSIGSNLELDIYHLSDEGVAEYLDNDGFESNSSSSYFTVEFTYAEMQYVMQGATSVNLADILEDVGLAGNVTNVECSNEELFSANYEDNGWIVTSHKAFSSAETMKVTIDGIVYEIVVTDARTSITAQEVVNYMNNMVGQNNAYIGYCLAFVTQCWVNMGFQGSYNWGTAKNFADHNTVSTSRDNIPVGANVYFYDSARPAGHIGIYVGDGYFVHAGNKSQYEKSRLSETYYSNHYTGWGWYPGVTVTSVVSVNFTPWSNDNYTYIRETDASIGMEINVSGGTITSEGMYLYDSNGSYLASASNPTHTLARVYFQVNAEMGYTLRPATLYRYKFYAIVNGQTYWSNEYTFITPGRVMTSGYDRLLPDGDYQIVSAANAAYYLDIEGTAVPAGGGTNVSLCGPDSGHLPAYEIWNITYSDGFYTIRQKDTDMCLDLANADTAAYANVQMCQSNGSNAQKWAISRFDDRRGYRLEVKCSGMSLDIAGGSISTGINVRQHPDNNTDAQRWLFIPYDPEKTIADGRYILVSALNPNLVLDISGDTADVPNETNVQVWNDSAPSRYNSIDVKYLDYGYYRLTHSASGKSLDVNSSASVSGTNVQLYTTGDQNNQKWAITKNGSGYLIWSRCNGLVLDVLNAGTSDGTNVVTANYNGSNAQTWKFVQAEYKVSYNANGGLGAPASQTKYYRNALKLSSTKPTRSGYTFKGWATTKTATSAAYQAGGSYTQDKSITLYAVWVAQKKQISDCTVTLSATSYTYNGKAKKPTVTVKDGTSTLTVDTDYTVSYLNNTNAGTATVTITGKGDYTGTASKTFTINKAGAKLTFANTTIAKTTKDAAFTNTLTKTTDGTVTFKSSNTGVATVNSASGLVTIKGAGTATITATASAGTNYKSGSASYTLTVTAPALVGFSDVQDPSHPYYKAIYWAADAGITKGYPDGTFGINRACTRSEAVMFLWRMAGKPAPVESLSSPFSDVPKTHAHYKAILWASQRGITKGYSDGTFGVNKTCTRGHIMTFIWRFKGQPAPKAAAKSPFSDVPKTHAYYKAILWGSQTGVTNGYSDGTFGINKNCTRGQIVTFLYRIK